jgi:serine/threonine-protein phosphatase PP1 catalytic subunit
MPLGPEGLGHEIEKKPSISEIKREIFETAGKRTPEQIRGLISQVESILISEKERGRGKLKDTIEQIRTGPNGNEYFVDGDIAYLPEKASAIFIGDIHGDAEAVVSIVEQTRFIENMEKGDRSQKLVFLGDYADRGQKDVETLEMVLDLKARYPDNVILLRGNHEEMGIGERYGLKDSLNKRFDVGGLRLFGSYNKLFNELPAACVTGNGIFAVHGGIPKAEIKSLRQLSDEDIKSEMRWADPSNEIQNFGINAMRGGTPMFGNEAFLRFIRNIGANLMIRGHEAQEKGVRVLFGNRLISLFSTGGEGFSSGYKNQVKEARFMKVDLSRPVKVPEEGQFQKVEYGRPVPEMKEREIELRSKHILLRYLRPIDLVIGDKYLQIVKPEEIGLRPHQDRFYLIDPTNPREEWDVIETGKGLSIGRDSPSRFKLSNHVSRRHLWISSAGDILRIEDLGSTNGTRVILKEATE